MAEPTMAPDLVRNFNSEVVHRASCSSRGGSTSRWRWAQLKTLADVSQATREYPWLHLCRTCLPGVCACGKCSS